MAAPPDPFGRHADRVRERRNKTVRLTDAGPQFYHAVVSGLETIRTAAAAVAAAPGDDRLTLACTHEISHLFVMPRFEALQAAVGPETRVMTCEYDTREPLRDAPEDRTEVFQEAVTAVCAPALRRDPSRRPQAGRRGLERPHLSRIDKAEPGLGDLE